MRATVVICVFSLLLNTPLVFYNLKMGDTKVPELKLHENITELSTSSGALQSNSSLDFLGTTNDYIEFESGLRSGEVRSAILVEDIYIQKDDHKRRNKRSGLLFYLFLHITLLFQD